MEGEYLTFDISLTDELSEDLPLNIEIIRDIEKGRYINFDDFHDYYEYSTDSGKNWKRVRTHRVIIPERSKNIKIRLSTIDDHKLEIDEEFTMKISPKTGSIFKISGVIPPKKLIVYDNEEIKYSNISGLYYKLNYKNEYYLAGLNRSMKMNKILKEYIDNGLDDKLEDDIKTLVDIGGFPINSLDLVYSYDSDWSGYVYNHAITNENKKDDWEMGLNLIHAYEKYDHNSGNTVKTDYNAKGSFGYVMIHEFGHIMTLNLKKEINTSVKNTEECKNSLLLQEGWFREKSAINQFNNQFYLTDQKYNEPNFVTDYAKTNIAEDIAETFAFYVGQNTIKKVTEESSGALRKINFIAENDPLKGLKKLIIDRLSSGQNFLNPDIFIRKFNRTLGGKRISCTDYESIKKHLDKHLNYAQ